ncbi:MAG: class C sortase [Eubacteriales bacterium]|nr:class C sortase [Eubacteriales bacterium]
MKRLPMLLAGFIFVAGLCILAYPFVSQYWNGRHQSEVCAVYEEQLANTDEDTIHADLQTAQAYNQALVQSTQMVDDPFAQRETLDNESYDDLLDITGDGIMAYLEIPNIDVYLPIYHGVEEKILKKGIGHLPETSLPVGGKSTHAVLCGHSGMSYAKLFTDLNQLKEGDMFYIHVHQMQLTYMVDQIKTVLPTDTSDLQIVDGEDYVTLITCTPYGVNSHRLLVRGTRISQQEAEQTERTVQHEKIQQESPQILAWEQEYWKYVVVGIGLAVVLLLVVVVIARRR